MTESRRTGSATGTVAQHARHEDRSAGSHESQAVLDVLDDAVGIGVDEHDVVGRLVHAGEHLGRATGDESRPRGRDLRLGERLTCRAEVLGLAVDRREGRARRAVQQPEARDAGARADLDDVERLRGCGDHGALRADGRADRCGAEFERMRAGSRDVIRFDRRLSGEAVVRVVLAHRCSSAVSLRGHAAPNPQARR